MGAVRCKKRVEMPELTCDYLVVGAGATAMAFVDQLVHASKEITVGFMLHCPVYFVDLVHIIDPVMTILIKYLADPM